MIWIPRYACGHSIPGAARHPAAPTSAGLILFFQSQNGQQAAARLAGISGLMLIRPKMRRTCAGHGGKLFERLIERLQFGDEPPVLFSGRSFRIQAWRTSRICSKAADRLGPQSVGKALEDSTEVVPTSMGRPEHVIADDLGDDGAQLGLDRADRSRPDNPCGGKNRPAFGVIPAGVIGVGVALFILGLDLDQGRALSPKAWYSRLVGMGSDVAACRSC